MKPPIDWEAVERDYRAGQISIREIGKRHGVSHVAIGKRAKADGWTQNLAARVREAVTTKLVTSAVTSANAREIIEAAADQGVAVVETHRRDIGQLRALFVRTAERMALRLDGVEVDGFERETITDTLAKLTQVSSRLQPLERQAYGLDAKGEGDRDGAEVDADGPLERLVARVARDRASRAPAEIAS